MQRQESLSAYMDGYDVGTTISDEITNSADLKQKWANYHLIRNVMQGDEIILGSDFSAKMEMLLENEQIESISTQKSGKIIKLKHWATPLMQAGIAASVCLVAVLGANFYNANNSENETAQSEPALQTLPFSNNVQAVSYNAPVQSQPTEANLENQKRILNSLLQNYELQRRTNIGALGLTEEQKSKAQTSANQAK